MSAMYTLVWRINGSKVSDGSNRDIVHQDIHTLTVITLTVEYSGMYSYDFKEFELFINEIEVTVKPMYSCRINCKILLSVHNLAIIALSNIIIIIECYRALYVGMRRKKMAAYNITVSRKLHVLFCAHIPILLLIMAGIHIMSGYCHNTLNKLSLGENIPHSNYEVHVFSSMFMCYCYIMCHPYGSFCSAIDLHLFLINTNSLLFVFFTMVKLY